MVLMDGFRAKVKWASWRGKTGVRIWEPDFVFDVFSVDTAKHNSVGVDVVVHDQIADPKLLHL